MAQRDPRGTSYASRSDGPVSEVAIRWKHPLDTGVLAFSYPSPVVADGIVYAVGQETLGVDARSGEKRFRRSYGAGVSPAVGPARAYRTPTVAVPSTRGVTALHGHGGHTIGGQAIAATRWTTTSDQDTTLINDSSPRTSPVATDELILAYIEGALTALETSSGNTRWTEATAFTRPAVHDGVAYVGLGPGYILGAIDLETGSVQRFEPADSFIRSVTVSEGQLLVATDDALLGVSPNGAVNWRFDDERYHGWGESCLAAANGTAYTGISTAAGSALIAIDTADGSLEWESPVSVSQSGKFEPPAVTDEMIYVPTEGGPLVGIDQKTGDISWQFQDGETSTWSPVAISRDALYAVSDETLYALEEA